MSEFTSRDEMFTEVYLDSLKGRKVSVRKNCEIGTITDVMFRESTALDELRLVQPEERIICSVTYEDGRWEKGIKFTELDLMFDEPKNDPVNHPSHYANGKYEVIDFIEDRGLNKSFHLGNAVKYIVRAGKKDPSKEKEDIEKAIWYLERFLQKGQLHMDAFEIPVGAILTSDFIEDKGLEGTPRGIALELIMKSQFEMAAKVLKMSVHQKQ